MSEKCKACNGTGKAFFPGYFPDGCKVCHGTGVEPEAFEVPTLECATASAQEWMERYARCDRERRAERAAACASEAALRSNIQIVNKTNERLSAMAVVGDGMIELLEHELNEHKVFHPIQIRETIDKWKKIPRS